MYFLANDYIVSNTKKFSTVSPKNQELLSIFPVNSDKTPAYGDMCIGLMEEKINIRKEQLSHLKKEEEKKKNSKHSKTMAKPKRVNNIDWAREYENGSYDDDDMDMYLSQ